MVYEVPRVSELDAMAAASQTRELTDEPVLAFGTYGEEPGEFIYVTDIAVLPRASVANSVTSSVANLRTGSGTSSVAREEALDEEVMKAGQSHIARVYVSEYGGNDLCHDL